MTSTLEPMSSIDPDEDLPGTDYYSAQGAPARVLDEIQVKAIIQRELEDGLGGLGSQVSEERRVAIRMFYGRPMGNEIKDRSQVVMLDVLEVVEWTMPSLMRMFTGGMDVVRFSANRPQDQRAAEIASKVINYRFKNKINGFQILYDWFKTCLLEKNGITKTYYRESSYPEENSYTGLLEDEMVAILSEEGVEPIAHEEYEKEFPELGTVICHDMTVRQIKTDRGVYVDGVPPEEFIIARRAITLDDETPFSAHRRKTTVSALVAQGFPFDEIANLPNDDSPEYSQGRTERLSEDETYPVSTAERSDAASRELWVTDCYVKLDEDGDGYAELRHILIVGEQSIYILEDEVVKQNPFSSICPVPMPHKFFGMSLADLVADLQQIRSTIMRQILDSIYLSTNPRLAVLEGQVELDDLLTVRPGGLIRQRVLGAIEPIQLPGLPREAFETLTYLEEVRANRTGIMAHGRELDASAINSTATGLAQLMAEKQQKIELIARIIAETGMKDMFRKMLRETVENATKEEQVEIAGEWVTFDARSWDKDMNVEIEVGLGAGQAIERLANLDRIAERQGQLMSAGMGHAVTPRNAYETAIRTAEAAGFKNPNVFFTDPDTVEPPEPEPNPEMEKLQLEAQKQQADNQLQMQKLQLDQFKEEQLVRHRAEDLAMKERIQMQQIASAETIALGQQAATEEAARISAAAKGPEAGETEGPNEE
jgi:hypothetical protein